VLVDNCVVPSHSNSNNNERKVTHARCETWFIISRTDTYLYAGVSISMSTISSLWFFSPFVFPFFQCTLCPLTLDSFNPDRESGVVCSKITGLPITLIVQSVTVCHSFAINLLDNLYVALHYPVFFLRILCTGLQQSICCARTHASFYTAGHY